MMQEKTSESVNFLDGGTVYFSGVKQYVSDIKRQPFGFAGATVKE